MMDTESQKVTSTPIYHRLSPLRSRLSWVFDKGARSSFKWHIYDNNGSYNGWFDWLPEWMRVGRWSTVACISLVVFYASLCILKPDPLRIPVTETDSFWFKADCAVCLWCIFVVVFYSARNKSGSLAPFYFSYTGWSWTILTARAGFEALSHLLGRSYPKLAQIVALFGSCLRFPAFVAAVITFTVWNFVLLPMIYFKALDTPKKRQNFLKWNRTFLMVNIHVLNLPLATINLVFGSSVRLFNYSDLWMSFVVVAIYIAVYLGVLDRAGVHFYPIFCIRSSTFPLSFGIVLYLYYLLLHKGNALILYYNPNLLPP